MDQFLFQEMPEASRALNLESLSEGIEEMDYAVVLTPEEMAVRKSKFTSLAIQEAKLEERKHKYLTDHKAEIKPIQVEKSAVLSELKAGSVQETGACFKVIEENSRMVGFYNKRGQLVSSRPMTQEDGQRTIKMAVNY